MTRTAPAQLRTRSPSARRRAATPRPAPASTRRARTPSGPPAPASTSAQSNRPLVNAIRETLDADDFGVIWLDCGGRPIREALDALVELAAELEGDVSLLDQSPTYAIALVRLPPPAFARFRGALALAGGAVVESGNANDTSETVFLVSQSA